MIKKSIHKFILWYTEVYAGGDFHTNAYGPNGRYIVSMNETQYHEYMKNVHYEFRESSKSFQKTSQH